MKNLFPLPSANLESSSTEYTPSVEKIPGLWVCPMKQMLQF